jgi:hypothetical protein
MAKKKRKSKLPRIGVVDCETDPFEPGVFVEPFIWGLLLDDGTYHEFEKTENFVSWCHAQTEKITLYAHNGGKFDYHFLRHDIESDAPISVIAGRLARAQIGLVELRDSLNLFGQTRLADFAKDEIDYRKMKRDVRHLHMDEIRKYLKSDCVNLFDLVSAFLERYGMQFTQAGAAMKYWQKHYAPRDSEGKGILPDWSSPGVAANYYEKFSPFYYGGRVQCFASGHKMNTDFQVVDINSAYPRAMLDAHPYSTSSVTLSGRLPKDEHVAQSMIELDAISKGALPLRGADGGLYFPEDETRERRYFITGWEFLAGIETGTLIPTKIHRSHFFGEPVNFSGYINHFFTERANAKLAGDKAQDIFCKIFMNGLYGKFASNPTKYREFVLSDPESGAYSNWLAAGYIDAGEWGGRHMLTRPIPPSKHRYYNIVTAASITGWVRAFLWRSLLKCSGLIYCDTDSIAAARVDDLDIGKKLGQWKLEETCDEYAVAGKKNYAFHVKGKPRPLDVKKAKPLADPRTRGEWEELRKCWKMASKGADLTPAEMIEAATGGEVLSRASVQNFSIHRNEFTFIDRHVRSTYKDIRRYGEAA